MKDRIKQVIFDCIMVSFIFIVLETILVLLAYNLPNSWLATIVSIDYWWVYDIGVVCGFIIVALIKILIIIYKERQKEKNLDKQ